MKNLTIKLKEEAHKQGFSLVGITTPDPPKSFPQYKSWIKEKYHSEMAYLASDRALERRENPQLILPECKSILVLGIHYAPSANSVLNNGSKFGQIAAYAANLDYHDVLKPRLEAIVDFLEEETGAKVPNRWYTDTGPVLERDLAHRAGLGWIGKNSMLIHPKAGSYFLLAEIFLGIDLDPDINPLTDHCGSCKKCIEACPTDCILPNRIIDANRCISYLTIENKDHIPQDLRSQIGDWIFGCDICQQVCPWNRFAPTEVDSAFSRRPNQVPNNMKKEFILSPQEFNKKFKGSPIKRSKRRGYLRNVAVVIGNRKDKNAIAELAKVLLNEEEPLVRQHAAWALGQIGGPEALSLLQSASKTELNLEVAEEIRNCLNN